MYDDDYAAGVADERERCARILDALIGSDPAADPILEDAAAAIRSGVNGGD